MVPPTVEEYTPALPPRTSATWSGWLLRTAGDAERQRAQIAFQGLQTKVSQITTDEGKTWYRVNVGPFDSRSQMNSAVDKLVAINIQPLVRKIPKE